MVGLYIVRSKRSGKYLKGREGLWELTEVRAEATRFFKARAETHAASFDDRNPNEPQNWEVLPAVGECPFPPTVGEN